MLIKKYIDLISTNPITSICTWNRGNINSSCLWICHQCKLIITSILKLQSSI